jgi:hypothetical protein
MSPPRVIWVCALCGKEERIHRTTDGIEFVMHHCPSFGDRVDPDHGQNKHRYVSDGIEVNVFPLKND